MLSVCDVERVTKEQAEDPRLLRLLHDSLFDLAEEYRDEIVQMWIEDRLPSEPKQPEIIKDTTPKTPRQKTFRKPKDKKVAGKMKKRHGHVYLMGAHNGLYKIGISTDVDKRLTGIQAQSPVPVSLIHSFKSNTHRGVESHLHEKYAAQREHGEWFRLSQSQVSEFCKIADYSLDNVTK